jgi:hypothetical protein
MTAAPTTLDDHWRQLVTAALLGSERRAPPELPPGAVADVVADSVIADDAARMLVTVAVVTAARRAAFEPLASVDPLRPPAGDRRPHTPARCSLTWGQIVSDWPVLEDEWMLAVIEAGYRLAPDVLVAALARHRNDPVRRARVALAGGPTAEWVCEHVPQLAVVERAVSADAVTTVPELAIALDLVEFLTADAHTFVSRLVSRVAAGEFGPAHRAVLINLLARCRREVLPDAGEALLRVGSVLSVTLADLCRLRHRMLDELSPITRHRDV